MKPKYLVGYKLNERRGYIFEDSEMYEVAVFSSIPDMKKYKDNVVIFQLVPVEEKKVKEYR